MRPRVCFLTLAILFLAVSGAAAQEGWVQVTTPNFTVVANGGERRAKGYRAAVRALSRSHSARLALGPPAIQSSRSS